MSTDSSTSSWLKSSNNPVLGGDLGVCFDPTILHHDGVYRLYFSWRTHKSVNVVESFDGIKWSAPTLCLQPSDGDLWEQEDNRQIVIAKDGVYHMWYTGQVFGDNGASLIGYAKSEDGRSFRRVRKDPVMVPDLPWEQKNVMCPHVIWDSAMGLFRMWYSAGEQYEPDAIGYATSEDGLHWTKRADPVFVADSSLTWEREKVTACQVIQHAGWHIMFYIGFADIDHAAIGIARSRDGIAGWERHPGNPIITPTAGEWDEDAVYKPTAHFDGEVWRLWYNGRCGNVEQIGCAINYSENLWP